MLMDVSMVEKCLILLYTNKYILNKIAKEIGYEGNLYDYVTDKQLD